MLFMQGFFTTLVVLSVLSAIICFIMLIIRAIKKRKKRPFVIGIIVSIIAIFAFAAGGAATLSPEERAAQQQRQEQKKLADQQSKAEKAAAEAQTKDDKVAANVLAKETSESEADQPSTPEPEKSQERTTAELLAENQKLLDEMKPKKEELKGHVNRSLSGYSISQVDPSVTSRDIFSLTFNLDAAGSDSETAKALGAEVIQKLIDSAPPYSIDSYYIMVMNKQAPIGMVSYIAETGIYSFMIKGKSQQFIP